MRVKKYNERDARELMSKGKVNVMYEYRTGIPVWLHNLTGVRLKALKKDSTYVVRREDTKMHKKMISARSKANKNSESKDRKSVLDRKILELTQLMDRTRGLL